MKRHVGRTNALGSQALCLAGNLCLGLGVLGSLHLLPRHLLPSEIVRQPGTEIRSIVCIGWWYHLMSQE